MQLIHVGRKSSRSLERKPVKLVKKPENRNRFRILDANHATWKTPEKSGNLRPPVKPGDVLNPVGINRKRPCVERYAQRSEDRIPDRLRLKFNREVGEEVLLKGSTWADVAVLRRFIEALTEGGTPAAKEIADSIEGKSSTVAGVIPKECQVYLIAGELKKQEEVRTAVGRVELTGEIKTMRDSALESGLTECVQEYMIH
jgi:hypothetical protein